VLKLRFVVIRFQVMKKLLKMSFILIVLTLTSCQSVKDTIKEIKDAKVTTKPKLEKPDEITIKVCCD
jgi:PBP1b-binding outer membrane lipoprotein LpoB